MEIHRFFADKSDINGGFVTLSGDEFLHATKVLRHKVGFKIVVAAGDGLDRFCTIEEINKDFLRAKIDKTEENATEPNLKLHLFVCAPKAGKLETVIQKAAELGVKSVTPVVSERTETYPSPLSGYSPNLGECKNGSRLQRVALEASKQCGRAEVLKVNAPCDFKTAVLQAASCGVAVMPYECERVLNLSDINFDGAKDAAVLVGAEGGFTPEEAEFALNAGIKTVSLGKRILRAETAAVVSCALVMFSARELNI